MGLSLKVVIKNKEYYKNLLYINKMGTNWLVLSFTDEKVQQRRRRDHDSPTTSPYTKVEQHQVNRKST